MRPLEEREQHAKKTGWFSSEVLATAVTTTSMRTVGKVEYVMRLQPLYVSPSDIHSCTGAVVNIDNKHWVALKAVSGEVWFFDSQLRGPSKMTQAEYMKFVEKRRAAYPIFWAEDMTVSSSASRGDSPALPLEETPGNDSMTAQGTA